MFNKVNDDWIFNDNGAGILLPIFNTKLFERFFRCELPIWLFLMQSTDRVVIHAFVVGTLMASEALMARVNMRKLLLFDAWSHTEQAKEFSNVSLEGKKALQKLESKMQIRTDLKKQEFLGLTTEQNARASLAQLREGYTNYVIRQQDLDDFE